MSNHINDRLPAKPSVSSAPPEPLLERLHRALGPLAAGLVLDFVDFATLGPIGLVAGLLVGAPIGWWVSSLYRFSPRARLLFSLLAGAYMTVPFTEVLPVATIIAAIARYRGTPTG